MNVQNQKLVLSTNYSSWKYSGPECDPKKVNTVGGVMGGKGFLKPKLKGTYDIYWDFQNGEGGI